VRNDSIGRGGGREGGRNYRHRFLDVAGEEIIKAIRPYTRASEKHLLPAAVEPGGVEPLGAGLEGGREGGREGGMVRKMEC